ncbi:MAG: acetylglutamate kinase [Pseudomonadota bacterium]
MSETRNIILELLGQLGSSREAREYLQRFSSVESVQFAVVKVGGAVLAEELEPLASALSFLRHVGLLPIVLHGAGPQLNQALADAGVESEVVDGMRVTTPEVMAVARPVIYEQNMKLTEALEAKGVAARSLLHGVFECDYLSPGRYGLVGDVTEVHLETLRGAVGAGAMPIVACLGESRSGQVMNINADVAARALVREVKPYKVIFLTGTGGLLNAEGNIIPAINLHTDYDNLLAQEWVHSGMRLKLTQIKMLLDQLPRATSVSITSATGLTRELFTHSGCGTLIRRGEGFAELKELSEEQRGQLAELLEQCFGRRLKADYFDRLELDRLLLADSGRAAALITHGLDGTPYLDKFAVTPAARGEGLASALWRELKSRFDRLYWRAKIANPINDWYHRQADISYRAGDWRVFSYGIAMDHMQPFVDHTLAASESWTDDPDQP